MTAAVPLRQADDEERYGGKATQLAALGELAAACERVYDGAHDIEWASAGDTLALLQRRPRTAG